MSSNIRLLMLADDITGAMDSGVKFSVMGIETAISSDKNVDLSNGPQVLVLNTQTRHLSADKAAGIITELTAEAEKMHIPHIFKKTDSILRGNIGAELAAALQASTSSILPFFPAFPDLNRTTKNGVQFYNQIPIHTCDLGIDPFNPIKSSVVAEIIHEQTDIRVSNIHLGATIPKADQKSIYVFDAETNKQMHDAVLRLRQQDMLHLIAGCGGVASVLSPILNLPRKSARQVTLEHNLLFVCGSLNPVTRKQISYAAEHGFAFVALRSEQQFDFQFVGSPDFYHLVDELEAHLQRGEPLILASDPTTLADAGPVGMIASLRECVSYTLAAILKQLLSIKPDYSLMISGGDLMLEFVKQSGIHVLLPDGELLPGTVSSKFIYEGKTYQLLSKSGGFGEETLLLDLAGTIKV